MYLEIICLFVAGKLHLVVDPFVTGQDGPAAKSGHEPFHNDEFPVGASPTFFEDRTAARVATCERGVDHVEVAC